MFDALGRSDSATIRALVAAGESIHSTYDRSGLTPILLVSTFANSRLLDELRTLGANPLDHDKQRNSGLMRAARNNNVDALRWFLGHGCNLDEINESGNSALHLAASQGSADAVSALLSLGANRELKNNGGLTAADLAAIFEHPGCLQLLRD